MQPLSPIKNYRCQMAPTVFIYYRSISISPLMNKITYIIDFGNMLISRLVRVLLNPSISAPPPSWLADDCFAVCLADITSYLI